jgi:hypothetical protein
MRPAPDSGMLQRGIAAGAGFCQNQALAASALMTLVLPAWKCESRSETRVHFYCSAGTWPVNPGVDPGDT